MYNPANIIPVADVLSRLPLPTTEPADEADGEEVITFEADEQPATLTEERVREASLGDLALQQLHDVIPGEWPSSVNACPIGWAGPHLIKLHGLWTGLD